MENGLIHLYNERKDDIERCLEKLRTSDECFDAGNFASVRRRPMLYTVIYYLQYHGGYREGVSLEELKAFLYCMFIVEYYETEKIVRSIAWCPIEQTIEEILGWKVIKTNNGKYIVRKNEQINLPYWNILEKLCKLATRISKDIINPQDDSIRKIFSKNIDDPTFKSKFHMYLKNIEGEER